MVQTLQLCVDRDQLDVVGDLSICLDGMTVDPEMFATAEANHQSESCSESEILHTRIHLEKLLSQAYLSIVKPVSALFSRERLNRDKNRKQLQQAACEKKTKQKKRV